MINGYQKGSQNCYTEGEPRPHEGKPTFLSGPLRRHLFLYLVATTTLRTLAFQHPAVLWFSLQRLFSLLRHMVWGVGGMK